MSPSPHPPAPSADAHKPRWERRKDARPAELIDAALDLFVDKGYAGTRLDDVAARAGVSKGTLYLYFANKEDLFKEVVRHNLVALITEGQALARGFSGCMGDLLESLIRIWWDRVGNTRAGGISKLMIAESGNFPEVSRFYLNEVIEPAHRMFESVIERGVAAGEFRAVDAVLFVRVTLAQVVMLMLWQHSLGPCSGVPTDTARYIDTVIDNARAALRPGQA